MKKCPICGSPMDDNLDMCPLCRPIFETDNKTDENETVLPDIDETAVSYDEEDAAENDSASDEIVFDGIDFQMPDFDIRETAVEETVEEPVEEPAEASDEDTFEICDGESLLKEFGMSGEEPVDEPAKTYKAAEELSMAERIRKYQIIPDSQPIEDDIKPVRVKKERKEPEKVQVVKRQKSIEPQKLTIKPKRNYKGLVKIVCIALVIVAVAVAAILILTNDSIKENLGSLFGGGPSEQVEVNGNLTIKWVNGKKYSSDFDVLKINKDDFRDAIEKSLRDNCTSEYNTLEEHYFGSINNSDNYIGYIDSYGVGIIFELTEKDDLIKSIYVIYDTSADANKGETLISNYTACILNTLGDIDDLSYDNLNMYSSSIKNNSFKSVATITRYNNFIIKKYTQAAYSALIITHGNEKAIEKLENDEVLEIVNCADEKYLKEALTEPPTEKEKITEFEEAVIYEVVTKGDPLNIRKGPGTDSEIIGSFESGTQVEVFGLSNGWAKIIYNNEEAWLSADYLKEVE